MPRKRQRFSRLNAMLRASGGNLSGEESELKNYLDFITGKRKITVENAISGNSRKPVAVSIVPFTEDVGATADDADRIRVTLSTYSYVGWDSRIKTVLSADELGWTAPAEGNASAKEKDFYPALAKFKMTRANAVTNPNKVSGVTGRTRSYTPDRSFSLPIGRTITGVTETKTGSPVANVQDVDYQEVTAAIFDKVTEPLLNGLKSITFEPEVNNESRITAAEFGGTIDTSNVVVN